MRTHLRAKGLVGGGGGGGGGGGRTFTEIGNQMQNHKIETNSELIYEDGSI